MNFKKLIQYSSSNLIIQGLNLLFSVLVVRLLSLTDLGKYNLAKGLAFGFQYASLSFRYGLDRRFPRTNQELAASQLTTVICINIIVGVLFFSGILSYYGFDIVFVLYCLGGLLFSIFSLYKIFFRGTDQFRLFVQSNIVAGSSVIIAPLIGLFIYGLIGLAAGYLVACFITTWIYGRKYFHLFKAVRIKRKFLKKIFFLGLPLYISSFFIFCGDYLDRFMIDYFIGRDAVGEFSIIMLLYSVMILVPSSILEMAFPEYVRMKHDKTELKRVIQRHFKINIITVFIIIICTVIALPYVFKWLFPKYLYLVEHCYVICMALLPQAIIPVLWALLFSFDKGYSLLWSSGLALVVYLLTLLLMLNSGVSFGIIVWSKVMFSYIYLAGLLYSVVRFKLHKIILK